MMIRTLDLVVPGPEQELLYMLSNDWTIPVAALLIVGTIALLIIHKVRNK